MYFIKKGITVCSCALALLSPLYSVAMQYDSSPIIDDEDSRNIVANASGIVTNVLIQEGDDIVEGQSIIALESIKVSSTVDGHVAAVNVSVGDYVFAGDVLVELE
ncbi:biotin/lipoyl-binding protein [Candidatus Fokinia crypta]|uniref:Biotinyl lipoyl domain protein n=1 Tax=Candidatus Fokinia crypta TaxID=1920990 RepID=A0ABZ0US91_9RICK|nr:biotin/lipoyl-binding protein [Candidatus Fokinia cryptica]WPX97770.1 Biotinyl lipoyl domain protein [Candidatus Fokinia cryptica]